VTDVVPRGLGERAVGDGKIAADGDGAGGSVNEPADTVRSLSTVMAPEAATLAPETLSSPASLTLPARATVPPLKLACRH